MRAASETPMATARFTLDGLARSAVRHDAVIALVYCAIALTLIEYLFIPRRASAWMGNGAVVGWLTPSMAAGLIWVLACLGFFFLLPYGFLRLIRADRPDDPDHPGHTGHRPGRAPIRSARDALADLFAALPDDVAGDLRGLASSRVHPRLPVRRHCTQLPGVLRPVGGRLPVPVLRTRVLLPGIPPCSRWHATCRKRWPSRRWSSPIP